MLSSLLLCALVALSLATSVHADDTVSYDLPSFSFGLDVIDETDLDDEAALTKFYWRLLHITERHVARQLESQGLGSLQLVTFDLALKRKSDTDNDDLYTEFTHFRADFSSGNAMVDASTVQSVTEDQLGSWTHSAFSEKSGLWLLRHEMSKDEWLERIYSVSVYFGDSGEQLHGAGPSGTKSSTQGDSKKRDGGKIALIVLIAATSLGLLVLLSCICSKLVSNLRKSCSVLAKEESSGAGSTLGDEEAGSDMSNDCGGSLCKGASVRKSGVVHPAPSLQGSNSKPVAEQTTSPRRKTKQTPLAQRLEMLFPDLDAITEGDEDASSLASSLASSVTTFFSPSSVVGRKTASWETHSPIVEQRKELPSNPPSPIAEEKKHDLSPCPESPQNDDQESSKSPVSLPPPPPHTSDGAVRPLI